jgi:hypothetical protein
VCRIVHTDRTQTAHTLRLTLYALSLYLGAERESEAKDGGVDMAKSATVARDQKTGAIMGWYDGAGKLHRCKAKDLVKCAQEAGYAIKAIESGNYGPCKVGKTPGVCLVHGPAPDGKKWVTGKCPGAKNIQCLVDKSAKSGGGGRRKTVDVNVSGTMSKTLIPKWWPYGVAGAVGVGIVGYLFTTA